MRVEWVGLGVNMRTDVPTVEALRAGVDEVLENENYALKARELAAEMAKWDPISIITDSIDELVAEKRQAS